jgi:hypothetical protein
MRVEPESLLHSCYSIETYKRAYAYNMVPLRGRVFWEKMNGPTIYPPLYTKVMGRPKKNRKKAPEEKKKNNGTTYVTRACLTMHCSICGISDHNKKGHARYVQEQLQLEQNNAQEELLGDDDYPDMMEHVIQHNPDPRSDPMHGTNSMVYQLGQEVIAEHTNTLLFPKYKS